MSGFTPGYMPGYDVRPAGVTDADRLGDVHVQAWREAYAGIMPADHLAALDPAGRAQRWRTILGDPAGHRAQVATADGVVVGFASGGPSRDDPPEPAAELWSIYLLAAHHGTGLADRLLAAVALPAAASVWVATANARARAFYARHGFVPAGPPPDHVTTRVHEPTGTHETRLVRPAG